jgi:hypothetical protein
VETSRREEARRREQMDRDRLDWHRHLVGVHAGRMKSHARIVDALESREQNQRRRESIVSETYEQLRDQATGEGAEAWRAADRATSLATSNEQGAA